MTLIKGTRVTTPRGPGTVAYVRNLPPAYTTPEAVSVVLDSDKDKPGYAGTIFRADVVQQTCFHEED